MSATSEHTALVAIRICAIAASTPGFYVTYGWSHINGGTESVWAVVFEAWLHARETGELRFAEAESMLRTGWRP